MVEERTPEEIAAEERHNAILKAIGEATNISDLVGHYIDFRDEKEAIKRKFTEDQAVPIAYMDRIEARLLTLLTESGQDSAKTPFGTAYKAAKTSAKVSDWNSLIEYVKREDAYDLLTKGVAKDAVIARIDATSEVVPGVDIIKFVEVNIRRS